MAASPRQGVVAAFPAVAQVNPDSSLSHRLLVDFTGQLLPGPRQAPAAPPVCWQVALRRHLSTRSDWPTASPRPGCGGAPTPAGAARAA